MKSVLLHTCCAPCLIYPLKRLKEKGCQVSGLFYNPNIHPFGEYSKRKQAVEDYAKGLGLEVSFPEYRPEEFFRQVNNKEGSPARCALCWGLRLKEAARQARDKGFDAFTTTLLVSPYQDQAVLKKTGEVAAAEYGLEFYYEDFRPGFREAHDEAKAKGIYCQKYCGCIYSEIERYEKRK